VSVLSRPRRTLAILVAGSLIAAVVTSTSTGALEEACPLPPTKPASSAEGLDMGIFVTDVAPTGAAATNLLGHLDALSGGDRSRLTIHLFSHYRGAPSLGSVEHEADVVWFADQGFPVELTVPYRVPVGAPPDPDGYIAYLESVVERLGPRLDGVMVTNEVNIDFWEGPSDGIHPGALDALVRGVPAADAAADRLGLDLDVGFKWAYRHPDLAAEAAFWTAVGDEGGDAFRAALDFVGVDLYAFDFYVGDASFAEYTVQALAELRACFLPRAGIGSTTPLRVTESGAPTLMWGDAGQADAIAEMVGAADAHSESLNVTAWRQWGLYCGPTPPGLGALFHCTGLLHEDGSPRPSYAVFAGLVAADPTTSPPPPSVTTSTTIRSSATTGTVVPPGERAEPSAPSPEAASGPGTPLPARPLVARPQFTG
jgi:hypothetical protein